jgi:hypothetical protein
VEGQVLFSLSYKSIKAFENFFDELDNNLAALHVYSY